LLTSAVLIPTAIVMGYQFDLINKIKNINFDAIKNFDFKSMLTIKNGIMLLLGLAAIIALIFTIKTISADNDLLKTRHYFKTDNDSSLNFDIPIDEKTNKNTNFYAMLLGDLKNKPEANPGFLNYLKHYAFYISGFLVCCVIIPVVIPFLSKLNFVQNILPPCLLSIQSAIIFSLISAVLLSIIFIARKNTYLSNTKNNINKNHYHIVKT